MRLITKINEEISIFADESQFIVKVRSKPNQRFDKQESWHNSYSVNKTCLQNDGFSRKTLCSLHNFDFSLYHPTHLRNNRRNNPLRSTKNLHLIPLILLGAMVSTFVYIAIVLAIGSISKSSIMAALGSFGILMALMIITPIISMFTDCTWILNYVPGSGAQARLEYHFNEGYGSHTIECGTDGIARNIIDYVLYSSSKAKLIKGILTSEGFEEQILYEEPLSFILLRSVAVASTYIFIFLLISWYALERAQVLE